MEMGGADGFGGGPEVSGKEGRGHGRMRGRVARGEEKANGSGSV